MVIIDNNGRKHAETCKCLQCLEIREMLIRKSEREELLKGMEEILARNTTPNKPTRKQSIDWFAGMLSGGVLSCTTNGVTYQEVAENIYNLAESMYEESLKRYGE